MRTITRLALVLVVAVMGAAFVAEAAAAPGSLVWKKTPDPTAGYDDVYLCARGPGGTVYAAGGQGDYPGTDIWVVKYTANGGEAWSRAWDGPDGINDEARGMAVDGAGNVYVCGRTRRASSETDAVLLKYDAGGTLKWARVYDPGPLSDEAQAVGLDAAGDAYLTGWSNTPTAAMDLWVAKFRASDGVRLWASGYEAAGQTSPSGIAVTRSGDCYVAGVVETAAGSDGYDALLFKTSASGVAAWAKTWDGPRGRDDTWSAVELAPKGGVIVAGTTDSSRRGDLAAARYASSGKRQWARTWSSRGSWLDQERGLAVARDGSTWVTGFTDREEGDMLGALVKWSASGKRLVARTLGSSRVATELCDVTLDATGNAYVAGAAQKTGGGWDLLAAKYSPAGRFLWRTTAGFGADSQDTLQAVCLGPAGYLYATGYVGWESADSRGVVVKIRR